MTAFTVASFSTSGNNAFGGLSFTPNVPGPNGTGSSGSASTVTLLQIIIGYPTSIESLRPDTCYVYSAIITDPDDVGTPENLLGSSTITDDGSEFGAGSYSRTWTFDITTLVPTQTYYIYFDATPNTSTKSPQPYTGGAAYADDLTVIDNTSAQFKIVMKTN